MGGFGRTSQFNDWNGIHEVVTWLVKSVNLKTTRRSNQFIAAYSNSQLYKYTGIIKRAIFLKSNLQSALSVSISILEKPMNPMRGRQNNINTDEIAINDRELRHESGAGDGVDGMAKHEKIFDE